MDDLRPDERDNLAAQINRLIPRRRARAAAADCPQPASSDVGDWRGRRRLTSDSEDEIRARMYGDGDDDNDDVMDEAFVPRVPRLWQLQLDQEQTLEQHHDLGDAAAAVGACPMCHVVSLAMKKDERNQVRHKSVHTFVESILLYMQRHCLLLSLEHICHTVSKSYTTYKAKYGAIDPNVARLPAITPAHCYTHFFAPLAHDQSNHLWQLARLRMQTQANLEDLNHMLWMANTAVADDNSITSRRLSLEAQKQFFAAAKFQLTITNALQQARQRSLNDSGASLQVGSVALGYNIADNSEYRVRLRDGLL